LSAELRKARFGGASSFKSFEHQTCAIREWHAPMKKERRTGFRPPAATATPRRGLAATMAIGREAEPHCGNDVPARH